jgi:hypothetical protein
MDRKAQQNFLRGRLVELRKITGRFKNHATASCDDIALPLHRKNKKRLKPMF